MFGVVPLMVFIMLTLLMVQLQSFTRVGMVVLLLPLGLIGVVGAFLATGRPLGFVAILGILALIGMIAKNAVIVIMQIASEEAAGLPVRQAAVAAATNRLRPLMLTATLDGPRSVADRADAVLGADGGHHHGRPPGGDDPHPDRVAGALRYAVGRTPRRAGASRAVAE